MTTYLIILLFFLSVHSVSSSLTKCPSHLPPPITHNRIINGHAPPPSLSAHLISFHNDGCAGTLLSSNWVLTAAHCLVTPSSIAYHAGSTSSSGTPVSIEAVYSHPDYDFPLNDISLVKLAAPVKNAAFVKVNENPAIPALGEFARVVGYGHANEYGGGNPDSKLFQVDVPVISSKNCQSTYQTLDTGLSSSVDPQQHICAGYKEGGCDACTQDSGGPLYVYDAQGGKVQIGIVSFGHGCARPNIPGGYLRLSKYVKWMNSVGAQFDTAAAREPVFDQGYGPSPAPQTPDLALPIGEPATDGVVSDNAVTSGGQPGEDGATVPSSTVSTDTEQTTVPSAAGKPGEDGATVPSSAGDNQPQPVQVDDQNGHKDDPDKDVGDSAGEDDSADGGDDENVPENEAGGTDSVNVVAETGVNVGAIVGGIVAAAVAVGLVIAIIVWRRWAALKGSQNGASSDTVAGETSSGEATPGAENV